jgi:hypothetical protein
LTENSDKNLLISNPAADDQNSEIAFVTMNMTKPAQFRWGIMKSASGNAEQLYESDSSLSLVGRTANGGLLIKMTEGVRIPGLRPTEVTLLEYDSAGRSVRKLGKLDSAYFQNITLSPDGRSLAYAAHAGTGDSIEFLQSLDRPPRRLVAGNDPRVFYSSIAFSHNGDRLFYGKQARWQVISMVTNFK